MNYQAVIFDLDGTVLDTLDDLADSINAALAQNGFAPRTKDEVRRFVGNGIRKLVERAVPEGTAPADTDRVYDAFAGYYRIHCADRTKPYDGIPALLARLREEGYLTAVVSNKADFAVQELCHRYFPGQFDAVAGEKPGVRRKPAPDAVNAVLAGFGLSPDQAVYVGDSDVDVETARNAGTDHIGVSWGFREEALLKQAGAGAIAGNADELYRLITAPGRRGETV